MTRTYPRSIMVPGTFDTMRVESAEHEREIRARLYGVTADDGAIPQPKRRGRPRGSYKRNAGQ